MAMASEDYYERLKDDFLSSEAVVEPFKISRSEKTKLRQKTLQPVPRFDPSPVSNRDHLRTKQKKSTPRNSAVTSEAGPSNLGPIEQQQSQGLGRSRGRGRGRGPGRGHDSVPLQAAEAEAEVQPQLQLKSTEQYSPAGQLQWPAVANPFPGGNVAATEHRFCIGCGAKLIPGGRFCGFCGLGRGCTPPS